MTIGLLITKLIDLIFRDDTYLEGPCRFRDKKKLAGQYKKFKGGSYESNSKGH